MVANNKTKSGSIKSLVRRSRKKKSKETSPPGHDMRPRRRASQTYFFKYQLARNPLKAEEEDLKLALLASLNDRDATTDINSDFETSPAVTVSDNGKSTSSTTSNTSNSNEKRPSTKSKLSPPIATSNGSPKPETGVFLTFICFRKTALPPRNIERKTIIPIANMTTSSTTPPTPSSPSPSNNRLMVDSNSSSAEPTRKSPRLATRQSVRQQQKNQLATSVAGSNSIRKYLISENDSHASNKSQNTPSNSLSYEEDLKRASIALEDMAQEISHQEIANDNTTKLLRGLMTREFAGAFADEETIFESISHHKL